MSSHDAGTPPETSPKNEVASEDLVGLAVQLAGSRPAMPREAQAALQQAARVAWQTKVEAQAAAHRPSERFDKKHSHRKRIHSQRFRSFALAATLLLSAGLTYLLLPTAGSFLGLLKPSVATVELSSDARFSRGAELKAGKMVETETDSRLALRLHTGTSLRLDADTQLELHSAERLTLHRGAVYLDSGPGSAAVAVETSFGIARDIGTQFEVRLISEGLRVAVREGEVRLEQAEGTHAAFGGTTLTVDAQGHVARASVPTHDSTWAWVLTTTPTFELEGSSMWEFLGWVTRETGWRLQMTDPGLERRLKGIKAHGSVDGLRPDEAIEVVLPSAGLEFEVEDGALILGPRE